MITNSGTANGTVYTVHDVFGNVLAELNATGATVREYIWLPEAEIAPTRGSRTNVDRPMAVVSNVNTTPSLLMVHVDHLHRPVKMTNAAGTVVWSAVYQPWGAAHSIAGAESLDARFPGQWYQLEAGLNYNWHRNYDPSLGRYTQPDPLGFVDGPNQYAYALSSPHRYVDKDGRVVIADDFVLGGLIITTAIVIYNYCKPLIVEMAKPKKPKYSCTTKCQSNGHPDGAYYVSATSNISCSDATKSVKASIPRGEYPRHCACSDTNGFRGTGSQCE